MRLTSRFVETVKSTSGARQEFSDDTITGLGLRVSPGGGKSWVLRYRMLSGERRKLTLGMSSSISLADARVRAQIALGQVAAGRDPAGEKQVQKRTARIDRATKPATLEALWKLYQRDHMSRKRASTREYAEWIWTRRLQPRIGVVRLAELDRAAVKTALRDFGADTPVTANKGLAILRHMLNWAVEEEFLQANPLAGMGPLYQERSRERGLSDDELQRLWQALGVIPSDRDVVVSANMCRAVKLVLATLSRANEVAGLQACELDIASRSWTIPAQRSKSGREHVVPLSPLAWGLLEEWFGSAEGGRWVGYAFPNRDDKKRPMERASLTRAMHRIITFAGIERATVHDLRRTGATRLASERIGVAPHVVAAVLGHRADGPRVTGTYIRHRYDQEKRAALQQWAMILLDIVGTPSCGENVLPMRAKG